MVVAIWETMMEEIENTLQKMDESIISVGELKNAHIWHIFMLAKRTSYDLKITILMIVRFNYFFGISSLHNFPQSRTPARFKHTTHIDAGIDPGMHIITHDNSEFAPA